ncbi:TetR/AcrR family transcriptional regulator [Nocardioides sp. SYSU D00038]|uniref:TetR/AcrR family transcriptional regulator n=1 Tax=Nocardioides sp. SYSU D00038 TaxID=2812554 RepID=UPI00196810F1|nr:TetR/AcrR family transcriptional regulator [Nocardioides sp. SYSU D00038]
MSTARAEPSSRRVPSQERNRRRVEQILDAAERLVVGHGVEALTTREIARAAEVPVASLYQYFADKEAVLLALAARDMEEMDRQLADDLAGLTAPGVPEVVRTAVLAFVTVYHRRRAFVQIYLRGRTNVAVHEFGREHNRRIAETLLAYARDTGLAGPGLTAPVALLAVEVTDRLFQLAFERDDDGDPLILEEGIAMMTAYLERYAA